MQTIEDLKRRIESTEDLQSVVKTMKALAAVKIRQFERAAASLEDYNETVEMALQVVLRNQPRFFVGAKPGPKDRPGAIVFGSDQGMCGQLNDQVVSHALTTLDRDFQKEFRDRVVLAVGERVRARLEDSGQPVEDTLSVPSSAKAITSRVQDAISIIERWNEEKNLNRIVLFHSMHLMGAQYRPHTVHLLPVDRDWLKELGQRSWPTRSLPLYTMAWDPLFSSLIRQYLFVSLFRAFAESLASENASRLASMEGAEKNIRERLAELNGLYHQRRQMSITEELLDIVAGFELLKGRR